MRAAWGRTRRARATLAAIAASFLLAACGSLIPSTAPVVGPSSTPPLPGENAVSLGVRLGPPLSSLPLTEDDAAAALRSFRESCARASSRTDGSGLSRPEDWRLACAAAASVASGGARQFFVSQFQTVRVADGSALATGYYEPEIAGVRQRQPGFDVPVYALPPDLVRAKPGEAMSLDDGKMPLGRYQPDGRFAPYHDRAAIRGGALMGRGLEIAWVADAVELFFLQVQGSGRLRAPDGTVMRLGYAGQNGHPYTGIGGVMRDRGLVGSGPGQYSGSMQGIMQYIREHPAEGQALMNENRSYVFFRELAGDGPVGALGVPVRALSSVAADPRFVPLGAPVWLDVDRREADGLWVAQDTGGAIKGANRFDTFWGAGAEARTIAGGMSARGSALILLPRGVPQRLGLQ